MFNMVDVARRPARANARAGMQLVPEERRIFGSLDVEENLVLVGLTAPNGGGLSAFTAFFPA